LVELTWVHRAEWIEGSHFFASHVVHASLWTLVSWSGGREDLGRGRLNHLWRSGGSDAGRAGLWDAFGGGGEAGIGGGGLALSLVTSQDATPVVAIEVVVLPVGTVAAGRTLGQGCALGQVVVATEHTEAVHWALCWSLRGSGWSSCSGCGGSVEWAGTGSELTVDSLFNDLAQVVAGQSVAAVVAGQLGDELSWQVDVAVESTDAHLRGGDDRFGGLHRSGDRLAGGRDDDGRGGLHWVAVVLVCLVVAIVRAVAEPHWWNALAHVTLVPVLHASGRGRHDVGGSW